jgi:hypothetical protein
MGVAEDVVVMQKFMGRFDSLEKVMAEGSSKRGQENKDFLRISALLTGVVGVDFIEGLVHQKQYE